MDLEQYCREDILLGRKIQQGLAHAIHYSSSSTPSSFSYNEQSGRSCLQVPPVPAESPLKFAFKDESIAGDARVSTDSGDMLPDESEPLKRPLMKIINEGLPKTEKNKGKRVIVVGGGMSGLCTARELKRAGFNVMILEASTGLGGRVKTFRQPYFSRGLHGEGGAMRIPSNHFLTHGYIQKLKGLELIKFEQQNKFIYLQGLQQTLSYDEFNRMLITKDPLILDLFPQLKEGEKGLTCDQLFDAAIKPVNDLFKEYYKEGDIESIVVAYKAVVQKYDQYTLRSYLTDVASWSQDAINLYDLGNAHVVFDNGFIESWKDAFLSSNSMGGAVHMQQLSNGMDALAYAFVGDTYDDVKEYQILSYDDIKFSARVTNFEQNKATGRMKVFYELPSRQLESVEGDYLVLAIPYSSLQLIKHSQRFSAEKEIAIRSTRYVEVTKILLQYSERWWEKILSDNDNTNGTGFGGVVTDLPIRYTMFATHPDKQLAAAQKRGVCMAAYTFQQDATLLGSVPESDRILLAANNLDTIFPQANSLSLLEGGHSQVWPADENAGGSAFCYFGPCQKLLYYKTMIASEWDGHVFFGGEQASYTHGWMHGAFEAGLRCAQDIYDVCNKLSADTSTQRRD